MKDRRWEPVTLTKMMEEDWEIVLEVFDAAQSERGNTGTAQAGRCGEHQIVTALPSFDQMSDPTGRVLATMRGAG